ncbi:hypothetical protein N665_0479s0007 [Sinapis alba]|nr:hypothetical protein N665_0479s0007 [Sinapis alba]
MNLPLAILLWRFGLSVLSFLALTRLRSRHSYYSRNCTVASTIEPKSIENLSLVQRLRRDKVVRVFKLNTGQNDHAIIFLDDYLNQVDRIAKRMEDKKQSDSDIFKWFKEHVLDSKLEPSIAHHDLCTLLSLGGKVKDAHITLLINAGLLTRQLIDPDTYWFAIPSIGKLWKALLQGRKEVLSLLKRKRHKEMFLSELEKKRLRYSPLDMRFHIRDLIGSAHLKLFHTTSGLLVRLSTD